MNVAILSNRKQDKACTIHDLPGYTGGYPGLGSLFGTFVEYCWHDVGAGKVKAATFQRFDLLWWEWSWAPVVAQAVLRVREACPGLKIIGFVGCADRWWEKTHSRDYKAHLDAARASTAIGTFHRDEVQLYAAMFPGSKPFHCPTPVDVAWLEGFTEGVKADKRKLLLGFHMNVTDDNRDTLAHVAVYEAVKAKHPTVEAHGFARHDTPQVVTALLAELGRPPVTIRNVMDMSTFVAFARDSWASVHVCRRMIQSQWSILAAALGIPHVSGTPGETQSYLWPSLTFKWFDIAGMAGAASRLFADDKWRQQAIERGHDLVPYYDLAQARERVRKAAGL